MIQLFDNGFLLSLAIHDESNEGNNNIHAHIMTTLRPINEKGEWQAKSKKEYILDDEGNKILNKNGKPKTRKIELTDWNDKIMNKSDDSSILKRAKFIVHANNIAGNYIIIKHFENEYSLLAHLKKDSFTVKEGECVSRGQVVALCENSGNSSEPHLHFQIQNRESFYNSLGVPILFRDIYSFKINGYKRYDNRKYMNFEEIPKQRVTRGHAYANRPQ